ncbi:MAG: putative type secretion system protein [Rhodospirillales bacterium]|nr:putative type secretion system protein [Rhodospirillales bacterium]
MTFGRRRVDPLPQKRMSEAFAVPTQEIVGLSLVGGDGLLQGMPSQETLIPIVRDRIPNEEVRTLTRGQLAGRILAIVREWAPTDGFEADPMAERQLVTALIEERLAAAKPAEVLPLFPAIPETSASQAQPLNRVEAAKDLIQAKLIERMDLSAASTLERAELAQQVAALVGEVVQEDKIQLNALEQRDLVTSLLNDMLGFGPLESLLADDTITDIMVNGPNQVYVERRGKLELTNVRMRDDAHVMNIATRIVSKIGRRIDETNPLCDARLPDGSRVNIIIPPLAIDGPSISIRKFSKRRITLDIMAQQNNLSPAMATVLKIAGRSQLNILISGGTGSGKTTLLNAISQLIDQGERIVTIEDAAELQLQQPHVVRLETRPANLEGSGEISMRELVKNALRMRPDRIILGEIRGSEAVDMLAAMNTGHEGSLGTIHANRPREALTRLENMIGLAGINLPSRAVRNQISSALDLIVQVSRMRDGIRRITNITEVMGMEGDVITTQELFVFDVEGEGQDGKLIGQFKSSGLRPAFAPKAAYFGLEKALYETMT